MTTPKAWSIDRVILVYETDTNDIMLFRNIEEAESYIEPQDVSEYRVFDCSGHELEVTLKSLPNFFSNRKVKIVDAQRPTETDVANLLTTYIQSCKRGESVESTDLSHLLQVVLSIQGFS
jgi:predicted class III extradiol MEMO1 family dioxygenase